MQLWLENFLLRHNYSYREDINISDDWKKCQYCLIDICIRRLLMPHVEEYLNKRFKIGDLQELDKNIIKSVPKVEKKYKKNITSKEGIEGFLKIHSWTFNPLNSYSDWSIHYTVGLTEKTVQTICRNCSLIGNKNVEDIIKRTLKDFEKNVLEPEIGGFARLYNINQNKGDYRQFAMFKYDYKR